MAQAVKFMGTYLMLGSGAFWILTYILLIQRGFKDQTYGMALVALCANLSWEFIGSNFFILLRCANHTYQF
ncbi:transmembrane-type terpene cyclase [Nostoc sp.]